MPTRNQLRQSVLQELVAVFSDKELAELISELREHLDLGSPLLGRETTGQPLSGPFR